jgi:Mn2+/Fe2+ NRAMP family transporter
MMASREWHWEQGSKYAVETIKALLVINGGAAVALLAFAGNFAKGGGDAASIASSLGRSLVAFGIGALFSALTFFCAYTSQLQYGRGGEDYPPAHRWHYGTYAMLVISVAGFLTGLWFARAALYLSLIPKPNV